MMRQRVGGFALRSSEAKGPVPWQLKYAPDRKIDQDRITRFLLLEEVAMKHCMLIRRCAICSF